MDEIRISEARYAKRQMSVTCLSDGSGFKTRAMRLCDAVKGRWSNREKSYIMSTAKAGRLQQLLLQGYDATIFGELIAPDEVYPGVKRARIPRLTKFNHPPS